MSHCHDGSDKERLVSNLGDDDDGKRRHKSMYEADVNVCMLAMMVGDQAGVNP